MWNFKYPTPKGRSHGIMSFAFNGSTNQYEAISFSITFSSLIGWSVKAEDKIKRHNPTWELTSWFGNRLHRGSRLLIPWQYCYRHIETWKGIRGVKKFNYENHDGWEKTSTETKNCTIWFMTVLFSSSLSKVKTIQWNTYDEESEIFNNRDSSCQGIKLNDHKFRLIRNVKSSAEDKCWFDGSPTGIPFFNHEQEKNVSFGQEFILFLNANITLEQIIFVCLNDLGQWIFVRTQ